MCNARRDVHILKGLAVAFAATTLGWSCTPKIEKRSRLGESAGDIAAIDSTVTDGVVTGNLSAAADKTQQMSGSGALSGSTVEFPPGSLAIDTTLTIEEGEDLSAGLGDLGGGAMTAAGASTIIGSSAQTDPAAPFTIQLPISGSSLALLDDANTKLVVLFKHVRYAEGGKVTQGVMPLSAITIKDGIARFPSPYFGVFQLAFTTTVITEAKTADAPGPIVNAKTSKTQLTLTFLTTSPVSPSKETTVTVKGQASQGTEAVELFSDAACTTKIASATKAEFEAGLALTLSANTTTTVRGIAKGTGRVTSTCTLLAAVITDQTAPSAPVFTAPPAYSNTGVVTWTWTKPASDAGIFRFKVDVEDLTGATEVSDLQYTSPTLSEGAHTFFLQARDAAGNWSSTVSTTVLVDLTAPTPTITAPTASPIETIPSKKFMFKGTCTEDHTVLLDAGAGATFGATQTMTFTCGATNDFAVEVTHTAAFIAAGTLRSLGVIETDLAGNSSTQVTRSYTYGMVAPSSIRAWYSEAGIQKDGMNLITGWNDNKATSPYNLTFVGTPVAVETQNGLLAAPFDSDRYYKTANQVALTFAPNSEAFAIFVAYKIPLNADGVLVAKARPGDVSYKVYMNSNTLTVNLGGTTYSTVFTAANEGDLHVAGIVSLPPPAANSVIAFYDRGATPTGDGTDQGSQTSSNADLAIGAQASASVGFEGFLDAGNVYEVIISKRTFTTAEAARVVEYLNNKWGVP